MFMVAPTYLKCLNNNLDNIQLNILTYGPLNMLSVHTWPQAKRAMLLRLSDMDYLPGIFQLGLPDACKPTAADTEEVVVWCCAPASYHPQNFGQIVGKTKSHWRESVKDRDWRLTAHRSSLSTIGPVWQQLEDDVKTLTGAASKVAAYKLMYRMPWNLKRFFALGTVYKFLQQHVVRPEHVIKDAPNWERLLATYDSEMPIATEHHRDITFDVSKLRLKYVKFLKNPKGGYSAILEELS
jgi:hypothetical protein